jgi:hypothetical protein
MSYLNGDACRVCFSEVDIVESMVQKLELYAGNLESLVKHRTDELQEEKAKTEKLLCQMLPP